MLLEDDAFQAKTIAALLHKWGYKTIVCHGGEEAVKLAASEKPDILVADLAMAGMNGSDAASRIAANPECADIGILFLSALVPQTDDDAIGTMRINGRNYPSVSKATLATRLLSAIQSLG